MYSFVEMVKIKSSDFVIFKANMTNASYNTNNAYIFTYLLEKNMCYAILSMIYSDLFSFRAAIKPTYFEE